jgi:ATP-dependent DNA helicase HFM1/MER3
LSSADVAPTDKELLAAGPAEDRHWQATQGQARLSLPSGSVVTPLNQSTTRQRMRGSSSEVLVLTLLTDEIEEMHATPTSRNTYSSLLGGNASSPTIVALSQRQNYGRGAARSLPLEEDHSSPLAQKNAAAFPVRSQARSQTAKSPSRIQLAHAPPVVQGIPLVSVNDLPDRLRSLFSFQLFNAVQSKCFATAFKTNENLVLSAPTGSGKTVVMELAICHMMHSAGRGEFKIVYQAPTKALCAERCADWQAKFGSLDLHCAELTGDTDVSQMRNVQAANIIITTPEKWDSITRRWKDHAKLMQLIKLFLIDEVHILKESRGATLEAVVSRMKSTGSNVRFIALSATVPNSEDVAVWLGQDTLHANIPAHREVFGEEFRPVQLQKLVFGYSVKANDFVFDSILESKSVSLLKD